jgi:sugar phosphate isomerase/epimerase
MKKIAIGAWAFGQYPVELFKSIKKLGFEGVGLGSFKPLGIHPDDYDTPEKCKMIQAALKENNLEVPEYGLDMYGAHALLDSKRWMELFERNICFADRLNVTRTIRVDTGVPPVLPPDMIYDQIKDYYKSVFRSIARRGAELGFTINWEFEPGFILNEPANVIDVVKSVNEPNFRIEFDTCHANNCALGIGHIEKGLTIDGGVVKFAEMCKDLIGMVHLIDTDGTLVHMGLDIMGDNGQTVELITSKHSQFGHGYLNFDEIIPALQNKANYRGEWWVLDFELTPFEEVPANLEFVRNLSQKYCK